MLHKAKMVVHKKTSEHVTCLFLRFGYKHNLQARLHNLWLYGQKRHSLEEAMKELKEHKVQSRTMHYKEDVKVFNVFSVDI